MKQDRSGSIIVGFFVIFLLVAGGLYLYQTSRYNEYPTHEDDVIKTKVTNQTSTPHLIVHKGGSFIAQPGETYVMHIQRHTDISASTPETQFIHRLSNNSVDHLHITPDGFRTNLSSSQNVDFVNASEYPVLFVQKSLKGGSLYVAASVPPLSSSEGHFVGGRSIWNVISTNGELLSTIHLSNQRVDRLVFDGIRLRSY